MCNEVGSANRGGECQKPGGAGGEQFKQKCDANKGKCEEGNEKFGDMAGADNMIDENEFKAAGLEEKLGQSFDKIAGADGKISQEEFDAAKAQSDKFDKAAGADEELNEKEFEKSGLGKELGDKKFKDMAGADGQMTKGEYMSALNDKKDSASNECCGSSDWRRKIADRNDDGGFARMSAVFNNNIINQPQSRWA